ncbi:ABC transporter substrate-binding protein [Clostridiaceae bacterium]|nr:ABC transporter substrate-binding protein [Clostridiaceae bacterium]
MKKTNFLLAVFVLTGLLSGCAGNQPADSSSSAPSVGTAPETTIAAFTTAAQDADKPSIPGALTVPDESDKQGKSGLSVPVTPEDVTLRVGSLKGPTSMGLVSLMDRASKGEAGNQYEFTMVTAADELLAKVVSGQLDIALIPANTASILYGKTNGQVVVLNVNTLGVLNVVSSDDSIKSIKDLAKKGKTVYMTGKGTTPDYVFRYLLSANEMTEQDLTLEFKSEPAEVAALLKEQPDAIGLLPQPFVTAACGQNENLKIVLDLTEEWDKVQGEDKSRLVTGVTIVRRSFLEENPNAVSLFLAEHRDSAQYANSHIKETAQLVADLGIIEKAPLAEKALPYCNITCLTGEEMKSALSGYLKVLYDQDPSSVGGQLPEDDFYFSGQ